LHTRLFSPENLVSAAVLPFFPGARCTDWAIDIDIHRDISHDGLRVFLTHTYDPSVNGTPDSRRLSTYCTSLSHLGGRPYFVSSALFVSSNPHRFLSLLLACSSVRPAKANTRDDVIYLVLLSRTQCHGVLLFITIGFFPTPARSRPHRHECLHYLSYRAFFLFLASLEPFLPRGDTRSYIASDLATW